MIAVFDDTSLVQAMLDFERALARAGSHAGVIPADCAEAISQCCRAELFDVQSLAERAIPAGTLAIPLVQDLTRLVSSENSAAGAWVHFGATSQDILDTALVLQLRRALAILKRDTDRLGRALDKLIGGHGATVMVGRTLLQPATPVTFALKVRGWRGALRRGQERIDTAARDALLLQFGGATGTLAALEASGPTVAAALARELDLGLPDLPWHVHRDRLVALSSAVAILVGSLGKMARDISLLMQAEVGEVFEPDAPGRGGSSAMPHKRNPVGCMAALAAAVRVPGLASSLLSAMVQEHERALGGWQAEGAIVPQLFEAAAGAAAAMAEVAEGLRVAPDAMQHNLNTVGRLVLSERVGLRLAKIHGREVAREIVEKACQLAVGEGRALADILAADERVSEHLTRTEIEALLNPETYLGIATPDK